MTAPISVRDLVARVERLPPSLTLTQPVVTGAALGGTVTLSIDRDGGYTFSGAMRATGFPSFSYSVMASIVSDAGVPVVSQHAGHVYGSDTPGNRQDTWTQTGTDPELAKLLRNTWPLTSHGTLSVTYSEELAGTLGAAVDVVKVVTEFVVAAATLGSSVACCLLIGSELHNIGITLPGLGGIVGLSIVAGAVFIYGPFAVVPATIAGVAAGAIVDSMVKIRPLGTGDAAPHGDETGFARTVFGDSLDFDRIRLTNLSGLGGRAFTAPAVDGTILINIGNAYDADRRTGPTQRLPRPRADPDPRTHPRLAAATRQSGRRLHPRPDVRRHLQPDRDRASLLPVRPPRTGLVHLQPRSPSRHRRPMVRRQHHPTTRRPQRPRRPLLRIHQEQHPPRQPLSRSRHHTTRRSREGTGHARGSDALRRPGRAR